jgi:hypothetical protein
MHVVSRQHRREHGGIGIGPRPRQTVDAQALTPHLHCPALNLHCAAELELLPSSQASSGPRICALLQDTVSSSLLPTRLALSLYAYAYLLTLLPSLTYTPHLSRTCLAEPLACPPLSRGPERRNPQRTVLTQTHCPTTSHPPACLRAPLAMTPS